MPAGSIVGLFTAYDPNPTDLLIYSIVQVASEQESNESISHNNKDYFLESNGTLRVSRPLDYETDRVSLTKLHIRKKIRMVRTTKNLSL